MSSWKINWQTKRKKSLVLGLWTFITARTCTRAWVPVKILAYWLCMLSNELLKEACLPNSTTVWDPNCNHFINSLSVYHLKEHVMKEIQTALTADFSDQNTSQRIEDMKDKRKLDESIHLSSSLLPAALDWETGGRDPILLGLNLPTLKQKGIMWGGTKWCLE